jgi:hypothetical protein
MKSIHLSDEQYKTLLDLVFLGNWMINSFRAEDRVEEYEELEQLILSKASDFNQNDYVIREGEDEVYFSTRQLEEEVDEFIEEYDNFTFWDELSSRLASRDMIRIIGPVKTLTDEHWSIKYRIENEYKEEFEKNELKNINIDLKNKR